MMRSLASTQFILNFAFSSTDFDLGRVGAVWENVGIQLLRILFKAEIYFDKRIELANRQLAWMDAAESLVEGVAQAVAIVGETWQLIPESWGLYWFKVSWSY